MAIRGPALPREMWQVVRHGCGARLASTVAADHRDIVILGGGVAGLALATALSASSRIGSNCSIALIEGSDLSKLYNWAPSTGHYENRVSSITADNRRLLQRIGAWNHVDESRIQGLSSMQVWDGLSKARISFDADEMPHHTDGAMAWLTENANLSRALLHTLKERSAVELIDGVRVNGIERGEGDRPTLDLDSGRHVRARLLIGADGFNSPVRKYAQIETTGWAYDTHAVVATLDIDPVPENSTAYQRFLPSGPIAFLPLNGRVGSLVWSTKPDYAKALKALDGATLAELVNAAFRLPYHSIRHLYRLLLEGVPPATLLDEIAFRSSRDCLNPDDMPTFEGLPPNVTGIQQNTAASFPLRYAHADSYISKDHVALLGDAAHTVHPLAGQGLNLGLGDVASLTSTIEEAVGVGADIGSLTSLQPYFRARYLPNHAIMSAVDKLHKLYSLENAPAVWLRSVGLETVNEIGVLKTAIMGQAGASGEGARETASKTVWSAAASGAEMAQRVAAVAVPVARRVGLNLAEAVSSRLRR